MDKRIMNKSPVKKRAEKPSLPKLDIAGVKKDVTNSAFK